MLKCAKIFSTGACTINRKLPALKLQFPAEIPQFPVANEIAHCAKNAQFFIVKSLIINAKVRKNKNCTVCFYHAGAGNFRNEQMFDEPENILSLSYNQCL